MCQCVRLHKRHTLLAMSENGLELGEINAVLKEEVGVLTSTNVTNARNNIGKKEVHPAHVLLLFATPSGRTLPCMRVLLPPVLLLIAHFVLLVPQVSADTARTFVLSDTLPNGLQPTLVIPKSCRVAERSVCRWPLCVGYGMHDLKRVC